MQSRSLYCRYVDIRGKGEYNYEYEGGRIVRATEAEVGFTDGIVTSKVIVNTIKYSYDADGQRDGERRGCQLYGVCQFQSAVTLRQVHLA